MPYHSPHGGEHHGDGWNHGGDHGHGHDHDGHHHHYGFYGVYGWGGYPYWPWYGWGYPYLTSYWPSYWNTSDDYDSQPASNYAASQYPEYSPGPYEETEPQQPEPEQPSYTPWPYARPAPSAVPESPGSPSPSIEAPVTLIFKDGRPNQQIHNYLLTAGTLSVLDQHRRDIPVDQIDLAATAKVNRDAGVEFSVPGNGR